MLVVNWLFARGQRMLVVNWLLARGQRMLIVNWLLARGQWMLVVNWLLVRNANYLRQRLLLITIRSWSWSYCSWIYNYLCNQCLSPLMLWVRISIRARCTTLCDKVCQWFATVRWFSPGNPVSSTNKTDRHDIAEMLLKMA